MQYLIFLIKQTYKQWFFVFVATIGLVSGVIQIFPFQDSTYTTNVVIFICCFVFSGIATFLIYKIKHIPDDEFWMLDNSSEKPTIAFPYQESYLRAANALARSHYGKNGLSIDQVKKWYEKNPLILTILTDSHNKFVGYFDIIPLNPAFGSKFIAGKVTEKSIRPSNILNPTEMATSDFIYIAGVSVKDQLTQKGKKHGAFLIYASLIYLKTFYDLSCPRNIYATAATECGRNLLEKLDFRLESDALNRKDRLDLYSRSITAAEIEEYRVNFSFCDKKMDWSAYKTVDVLTVR